MSLLDKHALLQGVYETLLIDFHEHCMHRIQDLQKDLVELIEIPEELVDVSAVLPLPRGVHPNQLLLLRTLQDQYAQEMHKVMAMAAHHCSDIVQSLRRQAQAGRPVTIAEVEILLSSAKRKFFRIRLWLHRLYLDWMNALTLKSEDVDLPERMDASKLLPALRRTLLASATEEGSTEAAADLSMESTLLDISHDDIEVMEEADWESTFELFKPSSCPPLPL